MKTSGQNNKGSLSSSDINRNLKNLKKDRHINVKIFTAIVVFVVGWFIYKVVTDDSDVTTGGKGPTSHDSTKVDSPSHIISEPPKPRLSDTIIMVSASNPTSLRNKLLTVSENLMSNGEYTPQSPKLNLKLNSFSCKLIKKKSIFIKLSLVWGPINNCESCDNSLSRNPRSEVLLKKESGNFIYQVTAIAK